MEKKTVVVNLLAGPGAGKTTCAWAIASELKKRGIEAEYVSEYAKDLVWDGRLDLLDGSPDHQKAIYEEQDHRVQRLLGKVDVVVTDSPALLSLMYIKEPDEEFTKDVLDRFNRQQNFNLFINRGKTYQQTGRLQTLEESKAIDRSILDFLNSNGIYFGTYYHSTLDVLVDNIIKNFNKVNAPENTIVRFAQEQLPKKGESEDPDLGSSTDENILVNPEAVEFTPLDVNEKTSYDFLNEYGVDGLTVIAAYEEALGYPSQEQYAVWFGDYAIFELRNPKVTYKDLSLRFNLALRVLHIIPEQIRDVLKNYKYSQLVEYIKNESTATISTNIGEMPIQDYREIRATQAGYDSYEEMYKAGGRLGDDIDIKPLVPTSSGVLFDTDIRPTEELKAKIKDLAASYEDDPNTIAELLAFKARFYQYSVKNTMLIQAGNPRATFVGSFQKFKELGYSIKKGEHGIKILVPVQVTLFRESPGSEWTAISKATKEQQSKIRNGEFETKKMLSFKAGTVFDISQTTCPIEDYPKLFNFGVSSDQHKEVCDRLAEFSAKELGCPVSDVDFKSIALLGQFNRQNNTIALNEKMEDTQRLSTLSHELGHAVMHRNIGNKPTVQVELEADAFSIMLNARFGIELTDSRKSHLAGHYTALKEYNESLANPKEAISLDTIIENASAVYEQHIETIERYVFPDQALLQETEPANLEDLIIAKENREIDVLCGVLTALKIDDVQVAFTPTGLTATDGDNSWSGAEFYKFLAEEAFVYDSTGNVLGLNNDLLAEFKELAGEYGVAVTDNGVCNVVSIETLKELVSNDMTKLQIASMDQPTYERVRRRIGDMPHAVLFKEGGMIDVAFEGKETKRMAEAIRDPNSHDSTQNISYKPKGR